MSHYTHLDTPCLSSMNSFYHSPFIAGMAMPESLIVLAWSLEAMPLFSSPCQILQDKIGTPFHFWHRSKIFVTVLFSAGITLFPNRHHWVCTWDYWSYFNVEVKRHSLHMHRNGPCIHSIFYSIFRSIFRSIPRFTRYLYYPPPPSPNNSLDIIKDILYYP